MGAVVRVRAVRRWQVEEEGAGGVVQGQGALADGQVPVGTPRTVVDAWNRAEPTSIMTVFGGRHCGARITAAVAGAAEEYYQACAKMRGDQSGLAWRSISC